MKRDKLIDTVGSQGWAQRLVDSDALGSGEAGFIQGYENIGYEEDSYDISLDAEEEYR